MANKPYHLYLSLVTTTKYQTPRLIRAIQAIEQHPRVGMINKSVLYHLYYHCDSRARIDILNARLTALAKVLAVLEEIEERVM